MRHHPRLFAVVILLGLLASCGGPQGPASFVRVGPGEFAAATASAEAVLVDIRTSEEAATGLIAGAVVIDFYADDFESRIRELDRGTHYLIYCNSSSRSASAVRLMKDLGFQQVTELDGGIQSWLAVGFPTVAPVSEASAERVSDPSPLPPPPAGSHPPRR
jgi:phage shock protein E